MGRYRAMLAIVSATLVASAGAVQPAVPETGEPGLVAAVIDGDTLALADGRTLRLAGIITPKQDEPLASAARLALADIVLERTVILAFGARRMDRHGRLVAQAWLAAADGTGSAWLQGRLLSDGLARVATTEDTRLLAAEMLNLEMGARAAGRGLWADPAYAVRAVGDSGLLLDRFQIVEGRPAAADLRRNRGYLNFGDDYKTDFTLSFGPDALRLLESGGISIHSFKGVRLRVRGWLRWFNGPMIDITHPEQIEVLE